MEAVKTGAGREAAHEAIKEHAVQVAKDMRTGKVSHNDLFTRLGADARLGLSTEAFEKLVEQGRTNMGDAPQQVDYFVERVGKLTSAHPEAAAYQPGAIL
jgi:adenylosuccinate lyase